MLLGYDRDEFERTGEKKPVEWHFDTVINPHALIVGDTGIGKTHRFRYLIRELEGCLTDHADARIHVLDGHGDIHVPGESVVEFAETTEYGFNPLRIDPDPRTGGVRRQVERFIHGVSKVRKLGVRQEAVLRYLLADLYEAHGFLEDEPATWRITPSDLTPVDLSGKEGRTYLDVPFPEKDLFQDAAKALGGKVGVDYAFDNEERIKAWWVREGFHHGQLLYWGEKIWGKRSPTLVDAIRFCRRKIEAVFVGANGVCINLANDAAAAAHAYHLKVAEAIRRGDPIESASKAEEDLERRRKKAVAKFDEYLKSIRTGREMSEVLRYDSVETLKSVHERLRGLWATGIFRPQAAPFDRNARVWRYDISGLDPEEQRLFVHFVVEARFFRCKQQGLTDRIRDVMVIDEAHNHFNDAEDNPINRGVKEGRKFGMAIWCGSQSPTHFPTDFLTNVGLKIILGLDPLHWKGTASKLGVSRDELSYLVAHKSALVHLKEKKKSAADFRAVLLPEDV